MKIVNVIRHLAFEDLGNLASVLMQFDAKINYIEAGKDKLTRSVNNCDLLIILGGPIGVYDDHEYPFIKDEIQLIQQRLSNKQPLLGICLGAQLIARAMGAAVYPGHKKELGWGRLNLAQTAENPLLKLGSQPILHWHGDTFDLPSGATLLAGNEHYPNQAFAVGDSTLAVQFHLEITVSAMEQWFIGHTGEIAATPDTNVNSLRIDSQELGTTLQPIACEIWQNWLALQGWENSHCTNQALTFKGTPITTLGRFPKVGEQAPDFALVDNKLNVIKRSDLLGKKMVLNIFPSIDTPVCAIQLKTFSQQLANKTDINLLFASLDLPFAYGRFCAVEGINNAITGSDYPSQSIAAEYGVKMQGGPLSGLYARAVLVLDENHQILHAELVSEVTDEPDYQAALIALNA